MIEQTDYLALRTMCVRHRARKEECAQQRGDAHRSWNIYGSTHDKYAEWFGLPLDFFTERIDLIRKRGMNPVALDLMANTAFLASLDIAGIAVALTIDEEEPRNSSCQHRQMVSGDLVDDHESIWQQIDEICKANGYKRGFDIVTLRGGSGLRYLTHTPVVHIRILQEMWRRLAKNGTIVTEVPELSRWLLDETNLTHYWNTIPGINTRTLKEGIFIEKSQGAPQRLPLHFSPLPLTKEAWIKGDFEPNYS